MAEWIKLRGDLIDSPKLRKIAERLFIDGDATRYGTKVNYYAVAGALARLWTRASQFGTFKGRDLVLEGFVLADVDEQVGIKHFAAAMEAVGWLRLGRDGVHLINFREHAVDPPKKARAPRKPKVEQPRNELFDAVATITGSDPKVSGSHVAKIANLLKAGEPPYTPAEVLDFGKRFVELCPWARDRTRKTPTLGEVEKHIGQIRVAGAAKKGPKVWTPPAERAAGERSASDVASDRP